MWCLEDAVRDGVRFYLPFGGDYTVGRKDCDVVLAMDQSVSRKHVTLRVQETAVIVKDHNSKYGTRINSTKVEPWTEVRLQLRDEVTFGQGSLMRLTRERLVVCCSGMKVTEKERIRQIVRNVGGTFANNWNDSCTHLLMSSVTVTVKVVSALASCRPIVTPDWLEEAQRCLQHKRILPACSSFTPPVVDANISGQPSLGPDKRRKSVFMGRNFYFLCKKQHGRLGNCVLSAGANSSRLLVSVPASAVLIAEGSIVVAPGQETDAEASLVATIVQVLQENQLRMIPESEIGYSILYTSTSQYCNPTTEADHSRLPDHLPPPSLSQLDDCHRSASASASIPFTQNTEHSDETVLACNSDIPSLSRRNFEKKGGESNKAGCSRVDESVLDKEGDLASQHPLNVTVLAYNSEQVCTPTSARKRVWQDDDCPSRIEETLSKKTKKDDGFEGIFPLDSAEPDFSHQTVSSHHLNFGIAKEREAYQSHISPRKSAMERKKSLKLRKCSSDVENSQSDSEKSFHVVPGMGKLLDANDYHNTSLADSGSIASQPESAVICSDSLCVPSGNAPTSQEPFGSTVVDNLLGSKRRRESRPREEEEEGEGSSAKRKRSTETFDNESSSHESEVVQESMLNMAISTVSPLPASTPNNASLTPPVEDGFLSSRKRRPEQLDSSGPIHSPKQLTATKTEFRQGPMLARRPPDSNDPASSLFAGVALSVRKRGQFLGDHSFSGSRPKFTQAYNDDMGFDDSDMDRKPQEVHPSDSQLYEMFRPRYDPILTADGFICTRKPPKRRPLVCEDFPYSSPPMPVMESVPTVVECVPLVIIQVKVEQDPEDSPNSVIPAGCKNFKRFKKVPNVKPSSVVRMIAGTGLRAHGQKSMFLLPELSQETEVPVPSVDRLEPLDLY